MSQDVCYRETDDLADDSPNREDSVIPCTPTNHDVRALGLAHAWAAGVPFELLFFLRLDAPPPAQGDFLGVVTSLISPCPAFPFIRLALQTQDSGLEYTFIRVGEIVEGKEGGSVMVGNTTDDLPTEQVVRDDIIRLSAEAFMMENATNTVR